MTEVGWLPEGELKYLRKTRLVCRQLEGRRKENRKMSLTFIGGHIEMALIPC